MVCIFLSRDTHRRSVSPLPLHTHLHPSMQRVNVNVLSVLGSSLEFSYYQMMTKYLIRVTPEKILEGNDSSDALWNGTIT